MRGLTIKREKSFVGCLAKANVYVHDELTGDTKINGEKCYKLGSLKNGEEKTFAIGDDETKIYVVADKLSMKLTNEICYIPAGFENVYLMGEFKYNPFGGNGFRFHGMTDPRVLANRKKSSKKFGVFFALCIIVGVVLGFFSGYDAPQYAKDGEPHTFVNEAGVRITLTDTFEEMNFDAYDFTYGTNDAVVFGFDDKFELVEGLEDYTVEEYAEEYIDYWKLDTKVKKHNDLVYIEYEDYGDDGVTKYCYMLVIYKTEDAFWGINFAVDEPQYEEYKPYFYEWAESVAFVEE